MSTGFKVLVGDTATPQARVPKTGEETYLLPISLTDATGAEIAYDYQYIVNKAAGDDTGFRLNMTDTASPGLGLLMDLQKDSVSKFKVALSGNTTVNALIVAAPTAGIIAGAGASNLNISGGSSVALGSNLRLHGQTHATQANDFVVQVAQTDVLHYDDSLLLWDFKGKKIISDGQIVLDNVQGFGNTTGVAFGDGDTILFEVSDDVFVIEVGGIEALRLAAASSQILKNDSLQAGLTAGTTQTQAGGLQLLSSYNEVATVANADDTVVLPEAVAGRLCGIINNGANRMQIFPAVDDDLGTGVNAVTTLASNQSVNYRAHDAINWRIEANTEIIHAEMHDEDNTDVFVINDAGADFHAYHTNGLVLGDTQGWTFDAGGAGTSHAITVIADGAASGVDIKVTTGTAHGLAVGAIISQTNLANAAYVGFFVVKAIIDTTNYEVAAVFTATGTGTMDEAATLVCGVGFSGDYRISYYASATTATNNETFDFLLNKQAATITGTKVRRKFGTAADFGSFSGGGVVSVANNDKISLALSNEDSAGDLTIRNLNIVITSL